MKSICYLIILTAFFASCGKSNVEKEIFTVPDNDKSTLWYRYSFIDNIKSMEAIAVDSVTLSDFTLLAGNTSSELGVYLISGDDKILSKKTFQIEKHLQGSYKVYSAWSTKELAGQNVFMVAMTKDGKEQYTAAIYLLIKRGDHIELIDYLDENTIGVFFKPTYSDGILRYTMSGDDKKYDVAKGEHVE